MKKFGFTLLAVAVVTIFANCGKNNDNGGPATMAATCANAQSSAYNTYSTYSPYGQTANTNTGGLCSYNYSAVSGFTTSSNYYVSGGSSCSYGQDAVYSPTKGKGCVATSELALSGQPAIYDLSYGTGSYSTVSAPNPQFAQYQQAMLANPYLAQQGSVYGSQSSVTSMISTSGTQTLRVCDGSEACPSGQSCRSPFGSLASPPIGVCYFN